MKKVLNTVAQLRDWRGKGDPALSIGFVPTMGGLHAGHFALVERSLAENDCTVVSIYLNRTQFNNTEDFERYPSSSQEDLAALQEMGVDAVFTPSYEEIYPDDYRYRVSETVSSRELEGEHRPGHFDGVLTVVMRLFNMVAPHRAYFGEKDWQQLQLVKGMVDSFAMPIEVIACPTQRNAGGLALSSRNRRLSDAGRCKAERFNQILNTVDTCEQAMEALRLEGFEVEYVAERDGRRLGAVALEGVRLIDNVVVAAKAPSDRTPAVSEGKAR